MRDATEPSAKFSNQPAPDVGLAAALFTRIHEATRDPRGGVTREGYGPGEQTAHDIVREAAEQAGLASRVDPAGNLYLTLPAAIPQRSASLSAAISIQSHRAAITTARRACWPGLP